MCFDSSSAGNIYPLKWIFIKNMKKKGNFPSDTDGLCNFKILVSFISIFKCYSFSSLGHRQLNSVDYYYYILRFFRFFLSDIKQKYLLIFHAKVKIKLLYNCDMFSKLGQQKNILSHVIMKLI